MSDEEDRQEDASTSGRKDDRPPKKKVTELAYSSVSLIFACRGGKCLRYKMVYDTAGEA